MIFKRGSTFSFDLVYQPDEGPDTLANYTLLSQIRNQTNKLVASPVVTSTEDDTIFNFFVEDTEEWPLGVLYWDISIKNDSDGSIVYTRTIQITVERSITQWPSEV